MKTKSKNPVATYEDSAAVMKQKSQSVEVDTINKSLGEFSAICDDMSADTIRAANKSREIGLHLITLCGHEQVSFEFWRTHCEGKVKCSFDQAKRHVSTAHKMPEPAKTIEDAAPFVQSLLFAAHLLEEPHREESQKALTISLVQKSFAAITVVRQLFEKTWRETPIEKMKASQLDDFLSTTEWLSVARDKAMKIRGEMYRNG